MLTLAIGAGCRTMPRDAPPCGEEGAETACFRGAFRTLVGDPVEGLTLCPEADATDCAVTDGDGQWRLEGLPLEADVALRAEHPDFTPTVFPQTTSMEWYAWFKVAVPPFVLNTHASRLDVTLDPERGHLLFLTWEGLNIDGIDTPNVPDVTAELVDTEGTVFYGDGLGLASASATVTSGSGAGGALNLAPGTARIRLEAPAGACGEQMFHWETEGDGVIPAPIVPGFVTAIDVQCPVD